MRPFYRRLQMREEWIQFREPGARTKSRTPGYNPVIVVFQEYKRTLT